MMHTESLAEQAFQRLRDELAVPRTFPPNVLTEVSRLLRFEQLATAMTEQYADLLDVPFVTLDPPGSRDLDQAFFIAKLADGWLVQYAIADVGLFVAPGSALEQEAWRRGQTLYSPDLKTPLYPPELSEGLASLLPKVIRPAIVFTFTLDTSGEVRTLAVARARVHSRAQLNYPQVSEHLAHEQQTPGSGALNGQPWSASLSLLPIVGRLRQQLEAARGGVSLRIPAQAVQRWSTAVTGYRLAFETASAVEEWNAQLSLMTGMGAARLLLENNVGLLRTLDPPRPERVQTLRLTALALAVTWPETMTYDEFVRSLDPHQPQHAVMLHQAARVTGGAHYVAFDGAPPRQLRHSAIAAPYAHVTAPLRRLADRYVLDLLVTLTQGATPAPELLAALKALPPVMATADNLARRLESVIVDYVEARLLEDHIGARFAGVVIALRADGVVVQIAEPPIRSLLPFQTFMAAPPLLSPDGVTLTIGSHQIILGQTLSLQLVAANPAARTLTFMLAETPD